MVDAFEAFHPKMGEVAARAFNEGWIDADPREDKHHSNYNHYHQTSADFEGMHPYVSVHFEGTLKSVLSLAHELGHAVADHLSGEETGEAIQGNALHESFAHFAETLVADHLVDRTADLKEKAAIRLSQFDMSITKLTSQGMVGIEHELYRATEGAEIRTLSSQEIADTARYVLRDFVTPQKMQQLDQLTLLKEVGRSSQIIQQRPFYNANYTLAEMSAMHMSNEYRGLSDEDKKLYSDHWVRAMQLGSKLQYGGAMDAMGMDITTPEELLQSAKKSQQDRMAEATRYLVEASQTQEVEQRPNAVARLQAERSAAPSSEQQR